MEEAARQGSGSVRMFLETVFGDLFDAVISKIVGEIEKTERELRNQQEGMRIIGGALACEAQQTSPEIVCEGILERNYPKGK